MTTPSDPQGGSGEQAGGWTPPPAPGQQPPQYGQPQYGQQPPQYGQPQYGQPQYGQPQYGQQPPQYGQPQYGQPQYGQPQYGQPQYGQPQYGQPQYGQPEALPLSPPPARRRGKVVALAAAAVVVVGGGVATYAAVSSSSAGGGAGDPKSAVKSLVTDLNASDLVGLLDDLPPGERNAISKPIEATINQLKRNDVLRPDANLNKISGLDITASGLTFASKTIDINDHVRIVEVTGGTIKTSSDLAKAPFTSDFLRAISADPNAPGSKSSSSVDIGQKVKQTGKPIRIATEKVGGSWYPSLLYTIADNEVTSSGLQAPSAADRIPAVGASSPDAATEGIITALVNADVRRAAELLSPDELGVVHDYGKLILDRLHFRAPGVRISNLTFTDATNSDGVMVTMKTVEITMKDGSVMKASVDGDCADMTIGGRTQHVCAGQMLNQIGGVIGKSMTPEQRTALTDLFSGVMKATGIQTTQVGGKWYVNPLHSYLNLFNAVLSGLKGNDGQVLLKMLADHH